MTVMRQQQKSIKVGVWSLNPPPPRHVQDAPWAGAWRCIDLEIPAVSSIHRLQKDKCAKGELGTREGILSLYRPNAKIGTSVTKIGNTINETSAWFPSWPRSYSPRWLGWSCQSQKCKIVAVYCGSSYVRISVIMSRIGHRAVLSCCIVLSRKVDCGVG